MTPRISRIAIGLGLAATAMAAPAVTVGPTARGAAGRDATTSPGTLARVYPLFPRPGERRGNLGGQRPGGEPQMPAIGRALVHPDLGA